MLTSIVVKKPKGSIWLQVQYLDKTTKKKRKTEEGVKKELMKSILNRRERFKNKKLSEKACENKKMLKNQRGDTIRMTNKKSYSIFKESNKFEETVKQLGISKLITNFTINHY